MNRLCKGFVVIMVLGALTVVVMLTRTAAGLQVLSPEEIRSVRGGCLCCSTGSGKQCTWSGYECVSTGEACDWESESAACGTFPSPIKGKNNDQCLSRPNKMCETFVADYCVEIDLPKCVTRTAYPYCTCTGEVQKRRAGGRTVCSGDSC